MQKPNLIILTSGRTGSGLLVQMALELGWERNDIEHTFQESYVLNGVDRDLSYGECSVEEATQRIESHISFYKEPWIIKSASMSHHWNVWGPILTELPRMPFLIHSTRNKEKVIERWLARGWNDQTALANMDAAQRVYDSWHGWKLELEYEKVASAAALVDLSRV